MKSTLLLISALLFCAYITFAQENTNSSDSIKYQLPQDVVVTAPRINIPLKEISFATSIIGNEYISTIPRFVSIDEALRIVPGVKIDNQANGNRLHLSIRGIGILTERGIRGIKILLDQIPLNDPTGFAPDFFDVDLADVSRVEVLRGPAASLFGGSASGGIINITTKNSPNTPLFGEAGGVYRIE